VPTDRRDLRRRLFGLATQQGGYFSAAQAKAIGYSYQAQAHHVAAGNWHRIDRGLFRLAEWVPEPFDDLRRWTVWSTGRAVVSHETALSVHGLGEFESPRVHLTAAPGFTKRDDALVIHRSVLDVSDVLEQAGFRVTTATRSIIDVAAAGADEDQLARAITEAVDAGLATVKQLRIRAEAVDATAALRIERAIHSTDAP